MTPNIGKRKWVRYAIILLIAVVLFIATMHILSAVDFTALHGG
jgi:hypothetical protein